MHIVRDLLDKAVKDRNGREMGRVDRVVVEVAASTAPQVVAIEIGASALGTRLGRTVGRYVHRVLHALNVDEGQPLRIHVSQILHVTDTIKVDLAFGQTAAANLEKKLRGMLRLLPGANR